MNKNNNIAVEIRHKACKDWKVVRVDQNDPTKNGEVLAHFDDGVKAVTWVEQQGYNRINVVDLMENVEWKPKKNKKDRREVSAFMRSKWVRDALRNY